MIAIIPILAAILFPVFARARENARRASCQSNLKQIGLSMLMYAQDYDELMVRGFAADPTLPAVTGKSRTWDMIIQPYMKSTQLLVCPSDAKSRAFDMSQFPGYSSTARRSYSIPTHVGNPSDSDSGVSLARVNSPSITVVCAERDAPTSGGDWGANAIMSALGRSQSIGYALDNPYRHLGTTNTLYADGHVKIKRDGEGVLPIYEGYAAPVSPNGVDVRYVSTLPQ